ncbi:hypothetical protein Agabi119p4_7478 [Agaricus bisporus var. burnettii]|uniref:50S ribosomal protein L35 n=1 Tax=Agaricus bisporus var. burnettii TaxID=192524 RepID=A0A8H7C8A6_AGABI|nr:hypothetical protein Agabi119p4_7478 [Agaricus bisporus var. burnettii]
MLLSRVLSLGLRTGLGARLFSTTSAVEAGYKLKSHSGAKKRWKSLASGNSFKRDKAYHSHLAVSKSPARKNRLSKTTVYIQID